MLFQRDYRPDPFRFRPPKIKGWLYPFFHLQNDYLLYVKFKFSRLYLTPDSLARLQRIRPGHSTLMVTNHTCYMDPHVMFDLSFRGRFRVKWLAGIEPFDSGKGVFGWFLQSVGAFSIDRGILDRPSLEMAQAILDEGRYPLVIYPEGEADYRNKILQPFYPGAALFALNTANKHRETDQPVHIMPVGVRYRFVGSAEATLQKAIRNLMTALQKQSRRQNVPMPPSHWESKAPLWEQLQAITQAGLSYLEHRTVGCEPQPDASLIERMNALQQVLLSRLHAEHSPETPLKDLSFEALMLFKNKLRSIIARKRHAPPIADVENAVSQVALLQQHHDVGRFSSAKEKRLKRLEEHWIGVANAKDPIEKRLKLLTRHLNQQLPYARLRREASAADLARWEAQENDTRRIKLLTLLVQDLERQDDSWEGVDEFLIKLELLLFSRFIYRGKKEAFVDVGKPLDVKRFVQENADLTQRQLQDTLTQQVRQHLAAVMILPHEVANPAIPQEPALSHS